MPISSIPLVSMCNLSNNANPLTPQLQMLFSISVLEAHVQDQMAPSVWFLRRAVDSDGGVGVCAGKTDGTKPGKRVAGLNSGFYYQHKLTRKP